jgi:ADP-ribosylglycohydrolase
VGARLLARFGRNTPSPPHRRARWLQALELAPITVETHFNALSIMACVVLISNLVIAVDWAVSIEQAAREQRFQEQRLREQQFQEQLRLREQQFQEQLRSREQQFQEQLRLREQRFREQLRRSKEHQQAPSS